MSPDQKARKLIEIRDGLDDARRLLSCGRMAVQELDLTEREALAALLNVVTEQLHDLSLSLEAHMAGSRAA